MTTTDDRISYASSLIDTYEDEALQQRLGLFQVFLKLYDHHQGLLDEILNLENSAVKTLARVSIPYVQGVVLGQQAYLTTNLVDGQSRALLQPEQTWLIGRDPKKVSIAIDDRRLSRCHAAIRYAGDKGFELIDLGSQNGTYVNSELIRTSMLLQDGDRVRLGGLSFVFFLCESVQRLETLSTEVQARLETL
jgi:pSer/pThr/pTyr-binding forkhead associated (FHA) protein